MEPYHADERVTLYAGDCLDVLRELDDASVDAVVTDPPYGLEFMGKAWDSFKGSNSRGPGAQFANGTVGGYDGKPMPRHGKRWRLKRCALCGHVQGGGSPCVCETPEWEHEHEPGPPLFATTFQQWCELWATECLRVLKPGGHMLAFGGTRTFHRLACAIEDAGFEIRDSIAWLYGSGFPKSLDVSKAIDKAAGAEREVVGRYVPPNGKAWNLSADESTPGDGGTMGDFGLRSESMSVTAPATDDARTWQGWGSALKPAFEPVVVARKPLVGTIAQNVLAHGTGALNIDGCRIGDGKDRASGGGVGIAQAVEVGPVGLAHRPERPSGGRWPANVILDESQAAALDAMTGESVTPSKVTRGVTADPSSYSPNPEQYQVESYGDRGGASRFFYTAKAPGSERVKLNGTAHPTVKPLDLMRWLVRLVTPPGGLVLDPFAGSGTTVEACLLEGFRCVAIEREPDYLPLIMQRINRRIDPVAAVRAAAEDVGLFDLLGEETA